MSEEELDEIEYEDDPFAENVDDAEEEAPPPKPTRKPVAKKASGGQAPQKNQPHSDESEGHEPEENTIKTNGSSAEKDPMIQKIISVIEDKLNSEETFKKIATGVAEDVAVKLQQPVQDFIESIDGIQNHIPMRIKQGMQSVLDGVQHDIQTMLERRAQEALASYVVALNKRQKSIGHRVILGAVSIAVVCLMSVVAAVWYVTPSYKDIKETRDLMQSMQHAIAQTPVEVLYMGKPYVRIIPDSELQLKGNGGVYTYAEIMPPKPGHKIGQ